VPGIYRTAKLLQRPQRSEGFDQLFRVQLVETRFVVEPMMEPD
jgi:hypothetical protein